jgi:oxygen-independent coproporphyrinogen III oxidase
MAGQFAKLIRNHLTGINRDYMLQAAQLPVLEGISSVPLYFHIPFCKSICPYCPYNKIRYDRAYAEPYRDAVLNEIEMYYKAVGRIKIPSIYIGGGTPTLLIDELAVILDRIRERFDVSGEIGVETGPAEIDDMIIGKMKNAGISMVSIGVQSFNDKYLHLMGRNYQSEILDRTISKLLNTFECVNVDLIAAMPGQTCEELSADLEKTINLRVEQVTIYPLFTFPYSSITQYINAKRVKKPNLYRRRKQYKLINTFFTSRGFQRSSVWSYKKGALHRYSSATREQYIGLGAGAGSLVPKGFYLNTFSVPEYIARCSERQFPTALHIEFTRAMHQYFWLYWRLYDSKVSKENVYAMFDRDDRTILRLLSILKIIGWLKEFPEQYELTESGAFWVHLWQNHFILDYINKVWSVCTKTAWPKSISLDS